MNETPSVGCVPSRMDGSRGLEPPRSLKVTPPPSSAAFWGFYWVVVVRQNMEKEWLGLCPDMDRERGKEQEVVPTRAPEQQVMDVCVIQFAQETRPCPVLII